MLVWSVASADDQCAASASCLPAKAIAEILHDLVIELLAPVAPTTRAYDLFHATTQAIEADQLRGHFQVVAEFRAQQLEENQFTHAFFADGQRAQVAVYDASAARVGGTLDVQA